MYTRCRQRVSQIAKTKKQHLNPFPKQLKKSRWSQQSFDLENMVQTLKTRRQIENLKYTFLFFYFYLSSIVHGEGAMIFDHKCLRSCG